MVAFQEFLTALELSPELTSFQRLKHDSLWLKVLSIGLYIAWQTHESTHE